MGLLRFDGRRTRTPCVLMGLCAALLATQALAADWELSLDLRAVSSDGRQSFLDNGLGKLRFDEDHQGLQLGRLRAAWNQPLGETFSAHAEASTWDDDDKNPIDLTEAYLEYRPYPRAGWKTRLRLGAFYPPMSLENRAVGWESPYTITPSAISSWVGEELRTIGLEAQVDWLGTRLGHDFDLQLTGAVFGWNDPAGTMLAMHGFTFHDRQTTLFGRVGAPQTIPDLTKKEVFHEMDDRPGFYVGAQARYLDRAILNVLHYDNRADPTVESEALQDYAWKTRFDAAALRVETASDWTLMLQAMKGDTAINPYMLLTWDFNTQSAMLAKRWSKHMLAVRYDEFEVTFENDPAIPGSEDGNAWAIAWSYDTGEHWRLALEYLRVESDLPARVVYLGETSFATESKLELSARYSIGGNF
jgi:hypothetical protein